MHKLLLQDRRIFQNHENRISGKTCISFQRRQNSGTFSNLLSVTDDLSDTGKEAGRKIHSRKDHNSTKKNGTAYNSRNRISAFLYKNWSYWWASWNIRIQYRLSDHDKEQHQKYHQTYKAETINYVISVQNKNSRNLA